MNSLIGKIIKHYTTENKIEEVSRRSIIKGICNDAIIATIPFNFLFKPNLSYSNETKQLTTSSQKEVKLIHSLLDEFNNEFLKKTKTGKEFSEFFSQTPKPIIKPFTEFNKIKYKNGIAYIIEEHSNQVSAWFNKFKDQIILKSRNPILRLSYLSNNNIPSELIIRQHESFHFYQDSASIEDKIYDVAREHNIWLKYLPKYDAVLFKPYVENIKNQKKTTKLNKFSTNNVEYSNLLSVDQVSNFYETLTHRIPNLDGFFNGKTFKKFEKKIFDVIKHYLTNIEYITILNEAQAYLISNVSNIANNKFGINNTINYMVNDVAAIKYDPVLVNNAVNLVARAYASLLNSNKTENDKHLLISNMIGSTREVDTKLKKYTGFEEKVIKIEEKYGKGNIQEYHKSLGKKILLMKNETKELFNEFLLQKGYSESKCLWDHMSNFK